MTRWGAAVAAVLVTTALTAPAAAWGHGLVGRQDLPIPRWLFSWGAAVVLVVSFVGLAVLWSRPKLQQVEERRAFGVPRAVEVLLGALGVAVFAVVVYAGLAGTQVATANLAPTVVYVAFWVGVPVLSLLFGDVFKAVNPWRAIGRAGGWVAKRVGGDALPEPMPYPERLGRWPAAVGIFVFVFVELAAANRDDPSTLATLALAYAATQLVGMSLFGVDRWTERGDAFAVYFGLFARLAPIRYRDGAVWVRPALAGAPPLTPVPGTVALLAVMIGSTSFDGFSQGTIWNDVGEELRTTFLDLGLNASRALEASTTIGLFVMCVLVGLLYRLGVAGMHTVGERRSAQELSGAFVHTLIPIALAYVLAHYFSLLAYQGQALAALASDPLGEGSDLLGTASATIDYTWVNANGIWYVQVGALVIGHVAGLLLAHDRALAIYRSTRDATRSQYWMLAVMVAFTSLGLWLLSAAAQE